MAEVAFPESTRRDIGAISLAVAEDGPADGPLVILLHGFPECAYGWRHQVPALAEAGLRVCVPDQRGYGASDKPEGVSAYRLDRLAEDVIALADHLGRESFDVVGHDWGGIVAWWVATRFPQRVRRLAILNAPHPNATGGYMAEHPTQWLKSWYVGFFQVPWLPERLMRVGCFRALRRSLISSSRPGTFSEADLARYEEAWAEPGALTAMVNWYRALRWPSRKAGRVTPPTLILWGRRDAFLEPGLAEASLARCDDGRIRWFDATHWIQHEEPEAVNAALLGFLRGDPG